ncbi:MAG: hypothetical protein B0D96_03635 [Candidatus Sedimenticola endophacoides]|nr:MAG: hypothetical protein B0D94_03460 [Candidatus Sedimenticola endophacoides]OQX36687.1 MAG: hypothetical protein B0D96_03635 [Candidatus Sedimenticola endophacoides]OQX41686.1 MAG: hypothetical protein B0D89_03325 [Candidatus Sedimenticola endophacoides]OQX47229.1 MAG: hypothetical protein B0D85_01870 [Candidatus Sedimenticola endophacoides]OQX48953.1 MAG: hypothetical protein B0D87_02930 [Candidatus Sedimenticola endophacoides]
MMVRFEHAGEPRLSVLDSGPGIPTGEEANVFKRFTRGRQRHSEGSGLGLSIVNRIVDLHGGRITLSKGLERKGAGIHVHFPASPDIAAPQARSNSPPGFGVSGSPDSDIG